MLLLNQLWDKSVWNDKKKHFVSMKELSMLLLQYYTVFKIIKSKMPGLETESKFNAARKSSASRPVPLHKSRLSLCAFKLNI